MRTVIEATCRECKRRYLVTERAAASVRLCISCLECQRWTLADDHEDGAREADEVVSLGDAPEPRTEVA